ncbi:hypothetical protein ACOBQJ_03640 [Pelotomaculum propionicicum]|uniref:hypothetical protein n=1 Tax=Pelotomaculum propionicicum TaxID=258475 RepID=UPI003B7DF941
MKYTFKRIDSDRIELSWENGQKQVMTLEEFTEFLTSDSNTLQNISFSSDWGMKFGDSLFDYARMYMQDKENSRSRTGERVNIVPVKETVKTGKNGIDIKARYKIVGESGEEHLEYKVSITGLKGGIADRPEAEKLIPSTIRCLLKLFFSGCHAIEEDEKALVEALEKQDVA